MKRENILAKKTARRYLKNRLHGDVSEKAVEHLQKTFQTSLDDFCDEAKKLHEEQNRLRKSVGLKEKKRFGEELFKKVSPGFLSSRTVSIIGVEGQQNVDTSISRSNDMEKKKTCSKKATICDGCEVQ